MNFLVSVVAHCVQEYRRRGARINEASAHLERVKSRLERVKQGLADLEGFIPKDGQPFIMGEGFLTELACQRLRVAFYEQQVRTAEVVLENAVSGH